MKLSEAIKAIFGSDDPELLFTESKKGNPNAYLSRTSKVQGKSVKIQLNFTVTTDKEAKKVVSVFK